MDLICRTTFLGSAGAVAAGPSEYWINALQQSNATISPPSAKAVSSDSSGNIYVGGSVRKADNSGSNSLFLKFDEEGALTARKELSDRNTRIRSLTVNGSDIYWYDDSDGYGKMNTALSSISWFKDSGDGRVERRIVVDSSGNNYISGRAQPGPIDNTNRDFFIAKHNSSGTNQWQRFFGSSGTNFFGIGCAILGDGNIVQVGNSDISSNRALYMVIYNSSGTLQASKAMTRTSTTIYGGDAGVAPFSSSGFVTGSPVSGEGPILTAHDADGDLNWARRIGSSSSMNLAGVCIDSSDNVIICADDRTSTDRKLVVIKFNSSGTVQWQRTIEHEGSGGYMIFVDGDDCIAVDKDDDILIAGATTTNSGQVAGALYVFKLPKDGPTAGTYGDYKITASSISTTDVASSYSVSTVSKTVNSPSASTPSDTSVTLASITRLSLVEDQAIS